jgi:type I restriction enzyme M protein
MPAKRKAASSAKNSSANLGFEAKLWLAADKLRNNMDAAEYKHVVLGLIFLKYISDTFEEHRAKLLAGEGDYEGADPEDPDEYKAENVFWVPSDARWPHLQSKAKEPSIGKTVDDAMVALERDNPRLKGVLPKDYARPGLDKHRLGELIDLIATIDLLASNQPSPQPSPTGRGSEDTKLPSTSGRGAGGEGSHRSVDLLGRVYEYFLTRFASAEGKNGGQFYTPSCVVRCLVEMLAPYKGRIYDPACGSGGMFVQSEKFVESHGGKLGDISIYGQESNATTRRLAVMNLAIRGIEADIGKEHADTFRNVQHPDLRADYVLANPPFNDSDWHRKDDDVRWKYGVPPKGNANFAWVQHFIHHLAPDGMAGFVLANGSMSSNQSGEGEIRKALIEADLVDCIVALPGQLFYSTQIPVCLWFLTKSKAADPKRHFRDRRKETLFIDARKMGTLIDRVHRELTDADLEKITSTYHAWRGDVAGSARAPRAVSGALAGNISSTGEAALPKSSAGAPKTTREGACAPQYADIPGFCKSATTDEIAVHGHVLTPGRYVGAEEVEDDGDPFEEKMPRLVAELESQFAESSKLEAAIRANLKGLGYAL